MQIIIIGFLETSIFVNMDISEKVNNNTSIHVSFDEFIIQIIIQLCTSNLKIFTYILVNQT